MKYKGAYSAEITYDVGDVVIYTDGLVYHLQKPADAGTPPHNTRYWEMLDKTLAEAVLLIADAQMGTIEDGSITTEKLDSALQNELVRDRASDESLWESGGISSSNGTNSSGSTRIRTKTYLGSNILSVSVASGYKYIVAVYESDVYKGMWNGSSLQKSAAWRTDKTTLADIGDYQFRLVFADSSDSSISASAGANCTFTGMFTKADVDSVKSDISALAPDAKTIRLASSTASSTKLFDITVDDEGTITATEYTPPAGT